MWDWISCNLLGRHNEAVWCEKSVIYLRCTKCGRRSSGWNMREPAVAEPPVAASRAPHRATGAAMRLVSGSSTRS